jgi:TonB family protein
MKSKRNRRLLLAILPFLMAFIGGIAKEKPQFEQERRAIENALEKVDIWGPGTPPFRLQATISITPQGKGAEDQHGALLLAWFAPGEWRESITLPGYTQVRIASKGKLWAVRSGHNGGIRTLQIEQLFGLRQDWTLWPGDSITSFKMRKIEGAYLKCVDFGPDTGVSRQLCVDPTSMLPMAMNVARDGGVSAEYGDYTSWGNKQFPRSIRQIENGRTVVELKVESLMSNGASAEMQLSPPQGGFMWESCDNPQPARVRERPPPQYPEAAKAAGKEGRVTVYLIVSTDGSVQHPQVVKSGGPYFDAATVDAVSRWRYQPAMCGTSPVVSERTETVNYILRE